MRLAVHHYLKSARPRSPNELPPTRPNPPQRRSILSAARAGDDERQRLEAAGLGGGEGSLGPAALATPTVRENAATAARERLEATRTRLVSEWHNRVARIQAGTVPVTAIDSDLTTLRRYETDLRRAHEARLARLAQTRKQALELADGFGARERAVHDLLRFALTVALRNRRGVEAAQRQVTACAASEMFFAERHRQDLAELSKVGGRLRSLNGAARLPTTPDDFAQLPATPTSSGSRLRLIRVISLSATRVEFTSRPPPTTRATRWRRP